MNQVARSKPGEIVSLSVLRSGQLLELKAEVGARPAPIAKKNPDR
jgi:serine protease DegS